MGRIAKVSVAIVALCAFAPAAMSATCTSTTNWGNLGPPETALFGQSFGSTGSYLDCYSFNLSSQADAFGGVIEVDPIFLNRLGIDVTSVQMFSGGSAGGMTGSLFGSDSSAWSFSFGSLGAGDYTLAIASSITREWGLTGGQVGYLGMITTMGSRAVPEPGSLALMAVGLLGVGLGLRRRKTAA